ncbi:hypothetical protein SCHPADRAFT_885119 [Schizopora paradoxa]|uniref:F-box domain-containing protein n=1 Tax=Schizopora paradoxa TaxID=27342 RepID=A0A0H2SDP6_9AGAM|nr:hypothetical protein SCHPADRAFT_885119 [Schizopora paradoxa]
MIDGIQNFFGLEAERACDNASQSARALVADLFTKTAEIQISVDAPAYQSPIAHLRNALEDLNAQLHFHLLRSEVFRRCLAAEDSAVQKLTAKKNEIVASINTIDLCRPCHVRLPDELILSIFSMVNAAEGGQGDTTLQKLLRMPDLNDNWRYAVRTSIAHSARESLGQYSPAVQGPGVGGRDVKLYEELKNSAPAKLDLSFVTCNIDSVRTALEFSDRWSSAHFRSPYSGPAVVDALTLSKEALLNVRHLAVELVEYRERSGGMLLPDISWKLYEECEPIRPRLRTAQIFLPFLSGLSSLLKGVEELELLLPSNYTLWEPAIRTLAALPCLTRLKISPCKIFHKQYMDPFSSEDLEAIALVGPVHLNGLESLTVNLYSRVANAIVTFIRCPTLKSLQLNTSADGLECARGRLNSASFTQLLEVVSELYPFLEKLSIQKSDERLLRPLATPNERGRILCPTLTSLDIPTPTPSYISFLLDFVRSRMSGQGVAAIRQLRVTNPGPLDSNCRLELSSLSLLVPDIIIERKEVNLRATDDQGQSSSCRVQ